MNIRWAKQKSLKFGDAEIEKREFNSSKSAISISNVNDSKSAFTPIYILMVYILIYVSIYTFNI